jgi:hypothetical protein
LQTLGKALAGREGKMKKYFSIIWVLLLLSLTASSVMAVSGIYGATCRTGGGACVDGIDVTDPKGDGSNIGLAAGDMCFVVVDAGTTQPELYVYRLYNSGTAESDPLVIAPNTQGGSAYAGNLRWHLVTPVGAGLGSAAVDGQNRIYITNNTSRTPAASANELFPVNNVWHFAENGVDMGAIKDVQNTGTLASPITSNPYSLTAANSYNRIIWYGATGTVNHVDAVAGMNFCVYNTGAFTVTFNPGDNTVIVRDGTAQSAGVSITLSSGAGNYVCFEADAANHLVTMGYKGTLAQGS